VNNLLTERPLSLDRMPRQRSAREDRGRPIEATERLEISLGKLLEMRGKEATQPDDLGEKKVIMETRSGNLSIRQISGFAANIF
jgi:hypothetical protein